MARFILSRSVIGRIDLDWRKSPGVPSWATHRSAPLLRTYLVASSITPQYRARRVMTSTTEKATPATEMANRVRSPARFFQAMFVNGVRASGHAKTAGDQLEPLQGLHHGDADVARARWPVELAG